MNRRQFLSGLGAALAGLFVQIKGQPGQDLPSVTTTNTADNWGTLFGLPIVENPELDTGIAGDIVLGDLGIYVSDELLQDAASIERYIMRELPGELQRLEAKVWEQGILYGTGEGMPLGILDSKPEHQEIVSLPDTQIFTADE